jgi:hypothetical protein
MSPQQIRDKKMERITKVKQTLETVLKRELSFSQKEDTFEALCAVGVVIHRLEQGEAVADCQFVYNHLIWSVWLTYSTLIQVATKNKDYDILEECNSNPQEVYFIM